MLGRIGPPLNPADLPIEPAPLLTICKRIAADRRADRRPLAGRPHAAELAELIERELGGFKPPKAFVD
ncbi:hypothetical protein [Rhodopseudomonas sp. BR0G17]|uniref:hypothetical protein n=1 Tax=Rhodopseudomonas sp. BR0G17 TaxID=2269368 RepID=UPI0013E01CD0|nr:hypothetical protein [Rhodopseudomonas sp. BR0G17]